MRSLLWFCFFVLSACSAAKPAVSLDPAQLPPLGGTLTESQVLDGAYLLAADLRVPAGITLTLKPGTVIYVQPSDSTKIDPEYLSRETEFLIQGRLLALGTERQPIVLRPLGDDREAILWSGLQLVGSVGSRLAHLRIEQAEAGLLCLNSSPEVRSLHVVRSRYGILLQQQSAPRISDTVLADGEAGLFCWDEGAPQFTNSWIVDQQEEGLYLGRDCRGLFSGNLIKGNDRGVVLPQGGLFDESNRVVGNRLDFVRYQQEVK